MPPFLTLAETDRLLLDFSATMRSRTPLPGRRVWFIDHGLYNSRAAPATIPVEDRTNSSRFVEFLCRSQLRRACPRNGRRSIGGAALFFAKPADAIVPMGGQAKFPIATKDLHYEVELAVALKGRRPAISADAAQTLIFGYAVALDMTRRDLQAEAKRLGRPWDMAKGF